MSDEIDVHFDAKRGLLTLTCGDEAFIQVRDAVRAETAFPDTADFSWANVRYMEIEAQPKLVRGSTRAMIGCFTFLATMLFVWIMGIVQIVQWFL